MLKTLVCLSGTFCDDDLWAGQVNALSDKYEFVFPSISTHDDIEELVADILKTLPESFSLMGMSAGVVVAFEILRQAPQKIEKLCIVAGNPNGITDELKQRFDDQLKTLDEQGIETYFNDTVFPNGLFEKNMEITDIKNRILTMANRVGVDAFKKQIAILKTRKDATEWLAGSTVPVLAVCGQNDKICPPQLHKTVVDLVQNGELVVLPNTGHYINFENENGLNKALTKFF